MGYSSRLIAYGTAGNPSPPPFSLELTAARVLAQLKENGGLTNVRLLHEDEDSPIVLNFRVSYPATENDTTQYSADATTYFREVPEAFRGPINGLFHDRNQSGTTGGPYTGTFTIPANTSHARKYFIFKSPKEIVTPILTDRFALWQFQFVDGNPEIALRKSTWTQGDEDDLNDLLQLEGYDTQIDTVRANLYEVYETLSGDVEENEPVEVIFIPEPRGILHIFINGTHNAVEVPRLLDTRSGTVPLLWDTTTHSISGNGLAFVWQYGYPLFAEEGLLSYPYTSASNIEDAETGGAVVTPDGTTATVGVVIDDDSHGFVQAALITSNTRLTPFLYSAQVNLLAGPRAMGGSTVKWDSNAHPGCIKDCEIQCDGENQRRQLIWTLRDPEGEVMSEGNNNEALESRMATGEINEIPLITKGLIPESTRMEMKAATENLSTPPANSNSEIRLTHCDGWELLDEDVMTDSPIGNGKRLGDHIRVVMRNGGWPVASLTGIGETEGRILPSLVGGERSSIRPSSEQSRGDYLRQLIDRWGMGLMFYQDTAGVWQLVMPTTTIKTISGHAAHFIRASEQPNTPTTYPGRFAVLRPLDFTRDSRESYNLFTVVGAEDYRGNRLARSWDIAAGYNQTSTVHQDKRYIGRRRRYPTVQDDSLRTVDDVMWVLRSLVRRYGAPGRFISFTTYFHIGLFPGDWITVDGITCKVLRVSGRIASDRMQLVVQEMSNFGQTASAFME